MLARLREPAASRWRVIICDGERHRRLDRRLLRHHQLGGASIVGLAATTAYDSSDDIFVDNSGTVNNAILLGGDDDQLVVNLSSAARRPLAGARRAAWTQGPATARSTTGRSRFRELRGFRLRAQQQHRADAHRRSVADDHGRLASNGSVSLNGTISSVNRTLVDTSVITIDQLTGNCTGPARKLSITNNGTLMVAGIGPLAIVINGSSYVTVVNETRVAWCAHI